MSDEDRVTVTEAMRLLGVSKKKIARLISEGVLHAEEDPLDKRYKWIPRAEVDDLLRRSGKKHAA